MRLYILLSTLLLSTLLLLTLPVSGAEQTYTVNKGEWLFIPVSMPEAKIGGGDFYNLQVELTGNDHSTEYTLVTGGVKLRSSSTGTLNMLLSVNHVTKSSCAGVEVSTIFEDTIQVNVVR